MSITDEALAALVPEKYSARAVLLQFADLDPQDCFDYAKRACGCAAGLSERHVVGAFVSF